MAKMKDQRCKLILQKILIIKNDLPLPIKIHANMVMFINNELYVTFWVVGPSNESTYNVWHKFQCQMSNVFKYSKLLVLPRHN